MKLRNLLLVGAFVFLGIGVVFGQVGLDTLGLTGTMADTVVADRLFGEMKGLINERKWEEADKKGEQAKAIYTRIYGEESRQVADVWHQNGLIGYNRGDYNMSLDSWEKSLKIRLKIFGEEHADVAKSYNNLGGTYYFKGEYDKAIEYKQKALNIRLKIFGEEHPEVVASYNNLGGTYYFKGEYDNAIEYYQKALTIQLKTLGPEHLHLGSSFMRIGTCYYSKGEYDQAIEYIQKALEFQLENFPPGHPALADSYVKLGLFYNAKGDYNKSIEFSLKAIKIQLKNVNQENQNLAWSFGNIAVSYNSKGEYDKSIEYQQKAIEIQLKSLGEEHPDVAKSYINLGISYCGKREYNKSIQSLQKALKIQSNTLGLDQTDAVFSYTNLGHVYNKKEEYYKAMDCLQKALEIQLNTLGPEHSNIAFPYLNLGNSYNLLGQYDKAIECFQKSLDVRLKTFGEVNPDVAMSYYYLGIAYFSKGDYTKAIGFLKKSLISCGYINENIQKINSPTLLPFCLSNLIRSLQANYNKIHNPQFLVQAYSYALQAIVAIQFQNATFSSEDETKSLWQTQNYPIYEQAISVSLLKATVDHNDTLLQSTFTYAEKSKSSLLQSQIKLTDALNFAGIPDSLLQKEHDLRIDITWREKQRQTLLDQGLSETDTNTLRISSIIFDLKNNYEALKNRFETDYPAYYRLKYDLSTVSLQYVQDTLLEPKNQALLEYFVGDSSIYLFVVRPDTMIVQEVKRDFPLEDWIEQFRQGLYGYYTADKAKRTTTLYDSTQQQYIEYSQKLYQKLFAPVEQWLPKQVIIVPDGPLGYVPFDALLSSKPEDPLDFKSYPYLLNKYQFSYTYSATLLKEMRDKKHHQEPVKEFAAFAPFYNGDTTLLAGMYQYDDLMRKDLQPLAYSGPEVAAASKLMRGETIAGPAATEERFTSTVTNHQKCTTNLHQKCTTLQIKIRQCC
jgi:tetratricopeptide (TPR) repeat protein